MYHLSSCYCSAFMVQSVLTLCWSPGDAFSHSRWDASWFSAASPRTLCAAVCPRLRSAGFWSGSGHRWRWRAAESHVRGGSQGHSSCPGSLSRAASEPSECPERTGPCIRGPQASPPAEALPLSYPSGDETQNFRLSALSTCPQDNGFRVLGPLFCRGFRLPHSSLGPCLLQKLVK